MRDLSNVQEATALAQDLSSSGVWNASTTITTYTEAVASAVSQFQQKYASQILTPNGLSVGTGFVGASTRIMLNSLYGCPATASSTTTTYTASTQCPPNYTCTPKAQTTVPICPWNLICTPISAAASSTPNTSAATIASSLNNSVVSNPIVPAGTYIPGFGTTGASTGSIYAPSIGTTATTNTTVTGAVSPNVSSASSNTLNTYLNTVIANSAAYSGNATSSTGGLVSAAVRTDLTIRDDSTWENGLNLPWSQYTGTAATYALTGNGPMVCRYPITDAAAKELQTVLTSRGINASFLSDPSTLYIAWDAGSYETFLVDYRVNGGSYIPAQVTSNAHIARCLDAGYVSNYPMWSKFFANKPLPTGDNTIPGYTACHPAKNGCNVGL